MFWTFSPKWVSVGTILVPAVSRTTHSSGWACGRKELHHVPRTQHPPRVSKCSFGPPPSCTERRIFLLPLILQMWPFWVPHSVAGTVLPPRPKEPRLVRPGHDVVTAAQIKTGEEYLCPVSTRAAKRAPLCTGEASISRLWGQEWNPSGLGSLVLGHPGKSLCIIEGRRWEPGWSAGRWRKLRCQRAGLCAALCSVIHSDSSKVFHQWTLYTRFFFLDKRKKST